MKPGRRGMDQYGMATDALQVRRSLCANGETVEWKLYLGDVMLVSAFLHEQVPELAAVAELFRLIAKEAEK